MAGRLDGKVCIITGSGGSIGRASALMFAREGARVVGCDILSENGQETLDQVRAAGGDMVSLHPCDLAKPEECEKLIAFTLSRYGRLDVLFNNAGKAHWGWMKDPSNDFWFNTINEELNISFLLSHAAWPALSQQGGAIVNVASTAGWFTYKQFPGIAHSAAKGGILAMTRHLAMEGREVGIRANSISPGVIENPPILALAKDPEWAAGLSNRILRGTFGKPEEIAAVALFLASDESSFVNAADIIADGGYSAW